MEIQRAFVAGPAERQYTDRDDLAKTHAQSEEMAG
jgi:hypothetical protein